MRYYQKKNSQGEDSSQIKDEVDNKKINGDKQRRSLKGRTPYYEIVNIEKDGGRIGSKTLTFVATRDTS